MRLLSTSMDTSPMAKSVLSFGWIPPWREEPEFGALVVARLAVGLAVVIELPESADRKAVRGWLKRWLSGWLSGAPLADRQQDASFFYVTLSRRPASDDPLGVVPGGPVREFGFGGAPRAPDEWEEVPLEHLVELASEELA